MDLEQNKFRRQIQKDKIMAQYNSILKPSAYLTLQEVAEWLNIKPIQYAVPADPAAFAAGQEELRRLLERMINIACDKVTNILQTPVIAKQFEETIDGNNSNVILPSKWPIVSVQEVKIDYNRGFGPETIITEVNRILRGYADIRQETTDTELRVVGNDVVLRDDGKDSIIGKIFAGSVIQCTKIKYTAGWAKDAADIPFDLRHATTLLVEYYYFQRSNRDLNITSKGVRGESFSKIKDGIPDTILELLEPYKDVSMPLFEKSQTNTFGV
jgi:hypothetical protein